MGRYAEKDSIANDDRLKQKATAKRLEFNMERDLEMLIHVRDAVFITNEQMSCSFVEQGKERNRQCFSWRIARLVDAGLLRKVPERLPYKSCVYTLTRYGLSVLETCGHGFRHLSSDTVRFPSDLQAPHFLELTEIRQVFEKTQLLNRWQSEGELTSRNYVLDAPLAKEYDAVAQIELNGEVYKIAIEYERSLKSSARYKEIGKSLDQESLVDVVLYLTPTVDNAISLASEFRNPSIPMCFASSRILKQHKMRTNVLLRYGDIRDTVTLEAALESTVLAVK